MSSRRENYTLAILNILVLCVVIISVSVYFVYQSKLIGFVLVALAVLSLASLKLFRISVPSVQPDIIFGIIDNGILAALAVFGGELAGVAGAIIGGVVGNAVTDGIAGIFEGYWAEKKSLGQRTMVGSAVGKMAGCLLGAGVVLAFSGLIGY